MNGLHLIGDLLDCKCSLDLLLDEKQFEKDCLEFITSAKLTPMESSFHKFENSGFTGTVVLAESHLAIHTWPEHRGLTLDVYVCNYSEDNSHKAKNLFEGLIKYFQPSEVARYSVDRGEHLITECLNAGTGTYIKGAKQLAESTTKYQTLTVYDTEQFGKLFRLDGCNMTSELDEFLYHECIVHPALTIHPHPKNILVIGGGDGGSSEEIMKHNVDRVVMVEIDAAVIDVAKEHFTSIHQGVFDNPKLEVNITNGIDYIRDSTEMFDGIVLDLNDPIGIAEELYTISFFRSLSKRLNAPGVLSLHLGSPIAHPARVKEIYDRLREVFINVHVLTVYIPLYGSIWAMAVCSDHLSMTPFQPSYVDINLIIREINNLKYYDGAMHRAMFTLPKYIKDILGQKTESPHWDRN